MKRTKTALKDQANVSHMDERKAQKHRSQLSKSMALVFNSLRPVRDGMNLVLIDRGGVSVWTNVMKADWPASEWLVAQSKDIPQGYALLIPVGKTHVSKGKVARKAGKKTPTPTPTPTPTEKKCYSVTTNSNGDLVLNGEVDCPK